MREKKEGGLKRRYKKVPSLIKHPRGDEHDLEGRQKIGR